MTFEWTNETGRNNRYECIGTRQKKNNNNIKSWRSRYDDGVCIVLSCRSFIVFEKSLSWQLNSRRKHSDVARVTHNINLPRSGSSPPTHPSDQRFPPRGRLFRRRRRRVFFVLFPVISSTRAARNTFLLRRWLLPRHVLQCVFDESHLRPLLLPVSH